jgi:threonine dehydratase
MSDLVPLAEIEAAARTLAPIVRATPLEPVPSIAPLVGCELLVDPEHRQLTGSFKIRGAYHRISHLAPGAPVVAASAGNHAQGVARAARLTSRPATIFMPTSAPLPKVEATRADGARIELVDGGVDDCLAAATAHAETTGASFVHPFDDPQIIAGQGTIGLELADELSEPATILIPVGGGGLISGVAAALRGRGSDVRIIGVEAATAAAMRASLQAGTLTTLASCDTIADGIAVKRASERTLAHCAAFVDEIVTVSDDDIAHACVLLLERAKAVVEPAGAAGLAALLAGAVEIRGTAVVILSGGNIDPLMLARLVEHGLTASGRFLVLRVDVLDRPGALANLTAQVAALGLNVLSVEHHRLGMRLGLDKVEVQLTVETRDPAHRDQTLAELRASGLGVELVE